MFAPLTPTIPNKYFRQALSLIRSTRNSLLTCTTKAPVLIHLHENDSSRRATAQWPRVLLCLLILLCLTMRPAYANVITLTQADVGSTGATSSYSYTSMTQTYTLSGAGAGIAAYADACSTAFMPTSGNIEIIARVATQSNITGNDFAGVMIRNSLDVGSPMACMGVEPSHGAHFIDRYFCREVKRKRYIRTCGHRAYMGKTHIQCHYAICARVFFDRWNDLVAR